MNSILCQWCQWLPLDSMLTGVKETDAMVLMALPPLEIHKVINTCRQLRNGWKWLLDAVEAVFAKPFRCCACFHWQQHSLRKNFCIVYDTLPLNKASYDWIDVMVCAIVKGHLVLVRWLHFHGVLAQSSGSGCWVLAITNGHWEVAEWVLQQYTSFEGVHQLRIVSHLLKHREIDAIGWLMEKGVIDQDIFERDFPTIEYGVEFFAEFYSKKFKKDIMLDEFYGSSDKLQVLKQWQRGN